MIRLNFLLDSFLVAAVYIGQAHTMVKDPAIQEKHQYKNFVSDKDTVWALTTE